MIFWFSGTGNSEYAARQIGAAVGDSTFINIAQAAKDGAFEYCASPGERVGFVFPVYYWGVPYTVKNFIDRLELQGAGYVWSCANCGGHTGNASGSLKKLLAKRNIELSAAYGVVMVENYIPMFDIDEDIDGILDKAEEELDAISESILAGDTGMLDRHRGGLPGVKSAIMYPFYGPGRKTGKFRVDDGCTGCGLCSSLCPEDAIEMSDGKPYWVKPQCSMCTACMNRCPAKVIQYGGGTAKRGRYYNPRLL